MAYRLALPSPRSSDREQYAVYSAYLNKGLTGETHDLGDKRRTNLIYDHTIRAGPPRGLPQVSKLLRFELGAESYFPHRLERRFGDTFNYDLIPTNQFEPEMWNKYPGSYGIITLSAVAFDRGMTEALFYTEHLCGLCGGDEWVLMKKIGGKWVQVGSDSSWVS